MKYNPGTGSYEPENLAFIPGTEFRIRVPYKVDMEKYAGIMKVLGKKTDIHDADVVSFFYDSFGDRDDQESERNYTVFVWPENSPEGSKDWHDCIFFHDGENRKEQCEKFMQELVSIIIGVDEECTKKEIAGYEAAKKENERCIDILNSLLPHPTPKTLVKVRAYVRYFEDGTVNGEEDISYDEQVAGLMPKMPCSVQVDGHKTWEYWCPEIDPEQGKILNWFEGTEADIHYKVCDECEITVEKDGKTIKEYDGYVPRFLCPAENGYGDYIIMHVDGDGMIEDWSRADFQSLLNGKEDE